MWNQFSCSYSLKLHVSLYEGIYIVCFDVTSNSKFFCLHSTNSFLNYYRFHLFKSVFVTFFFLLLVRTIFSFYSYAMIFAQLRTCQSFSFQVISLLQDMKIFVYLKLKITININNIFTLIYNTMNEYQVDNNISYQQIVYDN